MTCRPMDEKIHCRNIIAIQRTFLCRHQDASGDPQTLTVFLHNLRRAHIPICRTSLSSLDMLTKTWSEQPCALHHQRVTYTPQCSLSLHCQSRVHVTWTP